MINGRILIVMIALLAGLFLSPAGWAANYSEFAGRLHPGLARDKVVALLGEPSKKLMTAKTNRFIWGPEENFWDRIAMGTKLEVWRYHFDDGNLSLYFIEGGKKLDFIAFAPKGVVY
jgi:hypothetical protein